MATIRIHRGKWQAIVRRVGYPQKSKSFMSKSHAVKWARQIETDLDAGIVQTDTRILDETSVSDILVRYRETVTINKKGHSSECTRIDSFLKQTWASLRLRKVTSGIFSQIKDELGHSDIAKVMVALNLLNSFMMRVNEKGQSFQMIILNIFQKNFGRIWVIYIW